jgi:hypothetical protein
MVRNTGAGNNKLPCLLEDRDIQSFMHFATAGLPLAHEVICYCEIRIK